MGKGKGGRGGSYGGDYNTQSHGRGSSYSTAYGTCVNDDGTPLPAKYNATALDSAESMSLWARDNPCYLCLFKGHTSRRHPKFQNDGAARAAHNKSAWGMATRIINTGGTWRQLAAAMGLEPDLQYKIKWDVESTTSYALIIGLMEYLGGFAQWESGECPRNTHPTLWTPKNPPVDSVSDVHMGVEGQGSGGGGQVQVPSGLAAGDNSMDRGITRASDQATHQLPPSTASQGIIAASVSGANSRITKVEEDIHVACVSVNCEVRTTRNKCAQNDVQVIPGCVKSCTYGA